MYKKDVSYLNKPFSSETPQEDFFLYMTVGHLHAKCKSNKNKVIKIRTIGILKNNHGHFCIEEMNTTHNISIAPDPKHSIGVSVAYMNKPVRCWSMPYPVQLFGQLQWCGHPVIFAQILQPLNASVAVLLHETLTRVSTLKSNYNVDSDEHVL